MWPLLLCFLLWSLLLCFLLWSLLLCFFSYLSNVHYLRNKISQMKTKASLQHALLPPNSRIRHHFEWLAIIDKLINKQIATSQIFKLWKRKRINMPKKLRRGVFRLPPSQPLKQGPGKPSCPVFSPPLSNTQFLPPLQFPQFGQMPGANWVLCRGCQT